MSTYEGLSLLVQVLLLATTIAGVIIAYFKATEYIEDREERFKSEVKWRTEKAYENYRISQVLIDSTKAIFEKSKNGTDYSEVEYDHNIAIIINYLESMAIGIEQKIYNEDMLKDYIKDSIYKCVKIFIKGEDGQTNGRSWKVGREPIIKAGEEPHLVNLYEKWFPKDNSINFKNERK